MAAARAARRRRLGRGARAGPSPTRPPPQERRLQSGDVVLLAERDAAGPPLPVALGADAGEWGGDEQGRRGIRGRAGGGVARCLGNALADGRDGQAEAGGRADHGHGAGAAAAGAVEGGVGGVIGGRGGCAFGCRGGFTLEFAAGVGGEEVVAVTEDDLEGGEVAGLAGGGEEPFVERGREAGGLCGEEVTVSDAWWWDRC